MTFIEDKDLRGEVVLPARRAFKHPMLEIDFAEVSDPGGIRGGNEDYLGHVTAQNHGTGA